MSFDFALESISALRYDVYTLRRLFATQRHCHSYLSDGGSMSWTEMRELKSRYPCLEIFLTL